VGRAAVVTLVVGFLLWYAAALTGESDFTDHPAYIGVAALGWGLLAVGLVLGAIAVVLRLRRKRNHSRPRESARELGENREVGVEPNPLDSTDPQGQ